MAVLTTRAVQVTVNSMLSKVRKEVGDRSEERYSDLDIFEAIDNASRWCHNEMHIAMPETTTEEVTYPSNASSLAIPASISMQNIYYILDVTESTFPRYLSYVDPLTIEKTTREAWSIVDGAIVMRPKPSGARTLEVHVISNFIPVVGAATPATDQLAVAPNFERLIELRAANSLQSPDKEIPETRWVELRDLERQFRTFAALHHGPEYVRDVRGYDWS